MTEFSSVDYAAIGVLFPAIELWQSSLLLALAAGAYTVFGGLRAVVLTDALQAVLMIVGATLILIFGLGELGGWDALMARIDSAEKQLIKPPDDGFLPGPGILCLFCRRFTASGAFWAIVAAPAIGLLLFLAQQVTGLWATCVFRRGR